MQRFLSLIIVMNFLSLAPASAVTDLEYGTAAGKYLASVDMMNKLLSHKSCSYLPVKIKPELKIEVKKIAQKIPLRIREEFNTYLASRQFSNQMDENTEIISVFMTNWTSEGFDEKTSCGMLLYKISMLLASSKASLENIGINIGN